MLTNTSCELDWRRSTATEQPRSFRLTLTLMPPSRRAKANKRNTKKAAPAVDEPSEDPVEETKAIEMVTEETKAIETATEDNSAAEPSQDVTMEEAAPPEEQAPPPEETGPKMTMEERKAKMDQLRKKLVRFCSYNLLANVIHAASGRVIQSKPCISYRRERQAENDSARHSKIRAAAKAG